MVEQDKKWDWELVFEMEDGRRYWRDKESGRIAVADESNDHGARMGRPNETVAGVLWLHPTKPIEVSGVLCAISVISDHDYPTDGGATMLVGPVEALVVAYRFGIPLAVSGNDGQSWLLDARPYDGRAQSGYGEGFMSDPASTKDDPVPVQAEKASGPVLHVHLAQDLGETLPSVTPTTIVVDLVMDEALSREVRDEMYAEDAKAIRAAFYHSLPNGTFDRIAPRSLTVGLQVGVRGK